MLLIYPPYKDVHSQEDKGRSVLDVGLVKFG